MPACTTVANPGDAISAKLKVLSAKAWGEEPPKSSDRGVRSGPQRTCFQAHPSLGVNNRLSTALIICISSNLGVSPDRTSELNHAQSIFQNARAPQFYSALILQSNYSQVAHSAFTAPPLCSKGAFPSSRLISRISLPPSYRKGKLHQG